MLTPFVRNYILAQAQTKVLSQTQGLYPAPLRILEVCITPLFSLTKSFFRILGDQTDIREGF